MQSILPIIICVNNPIVKTLSTTDATIQCNAMQSILRIIICVNNIVIFQKDHSVRPLW